MKQLFTFVLAAMAFVACTQNEVEELTANRMDVPETLTVGFEGGDTRIELNNALKSVWSKGDEVSVFYRSDINQRWQYQGETGERVGDLRRVDAGSGTPTKTTKVVIAYPYSDSYYLNTETCDIQAMLPAVQSYKAGSYGEGGNILVSQSEYNQFSLKSVCGWLRVELTGEGQMVESITLRGNAGEQVAGELYIDTATAEATLASERGEAGEGAGGSLIFDDTMFTEVTLDCGSGVELGAEATEFYIALPPQTFAEGMTIEVNCAGYKPMTLSTESSITIERNHIVPMEAVEHDARVILPSNELWYTATALVEPNNTSAFNVAIVSNEWNEATGEGVITFDGELTTIGDGVFEDCDSLTSVTIHDSVTTIGDSAFEDCDSLTSVTIHDSVTTIGKTAFASCSSLTSVTIPDSVATIGYAAFYNCDSLISVTIGDSVTTIGYDAFYECSSLTSVYCEATTPPTLGDYVFWGYDNNWNHVMLDCDIYVPAESVEAYKAAENWNEYADYIVGYDFETGKEVAISNKLFYTSTALVEPNSTSAFNVAITSNKWDETTGEGIITFDGKLTTIGNGVFEGCYSLTSVTIPDSVTSIGDWAFYECTSLTSVTIPDSVTTIGEGAFRSCDSLTSVTIGDSVTTIGDGVFAVCSNLAEFKGKFAADGGRCLIKDNTLIAYAEASGTIYTIPDSVTTIGNEAFEYCGSLTSVTISDSVTTIGEDAFDGCSSLTSVTIPDSVTSIGDWAFEDCDSLTSVTIGNSVTSIGDYAFAYCDDLTSVYCKAPTPPTLGFYVFDDNASGRKIYAYEECVDIYKAAWSEYADSIVAGGNILESVTTTILYTTSDGAVIDASKFPVKSHTYNNGIGELIVYGELKAIPNSAFYEFGTLTTITIPDNVTTIGSMAFFGCDSLTSVTIPDSVMTIGYAAFENCDNLTSVTIGDSVTTIGERAFYWCYRLTSVTIPDSVTTIGYEAFCNCTSLTSVTIPSSVTTIGDGVFAVCSNLAEFKGKFAADGGRCLIKDNTLIAYANASGTTYTIPDSVTVIGAEVFLGCNGLTSVTIPDSVTTIGGAAFFNCYSLTSVTIPDSVTTIGDEAFSNCNSLTSVYCKATTPPSLGDDVFKYWDESAQEVVNIGCAIYVPAESVKAYKAAENWSEYAADIVGYDFE